MIGTLFTAMQPLLKCLRVFAQVRLSCRPPRYTLQSSANSGELYNSIKTCGYAQHVCGQGVASPLFI